MQDLKNIYKCFCSFYGTTQWKLPYSYGFWYFLPSSPVSWMLLKMSWSKLGVHLFLTSGILGSRFFWFEFFFFKTIGNRRISRKRRGVGVGEVKSISSSAEVLTGTYNLHCSYSMDTHKSCSFPVLYCTFWISLMQCSLLSGPWAPEDSGSIHSEKASYFILAHVFMCSLWILTTCWVPVWLHLFNMSLESRGTAVMMCQLQKL